jgi:carbamate kinase
VLPAVPDVVRADDPAFASPAKFVGPVYEESRARRLAAERGWQIRQDGQSWRRVVPSPEPVELVELNIIRQLADGGAIVVCARCAASRRSWTRT